ncbi:hypothetical protein D3C79_1061000 [compost metagenome]
MADMQDAIPFLQRVFQAFRATLHHVVRHVRLLLAEDVGHFEEVSEIETPTRRFI